MHGRTAMRLLVSGRRALLNTSKRCQFLLRYLHIYMPRDIRCSHEVELAIRKAVEAAAENGCNRMGWTAAAAVPAGGRTGRDSHHKTVDDASLCETVKDLR